MAGISNSIYLNDQMSPVLAAIVSNMNNVIYAMERLETVSNKPVSSQAFSTMQEAIPSISQIEYGMNVTAPMPETIGAQQAVNTEQTNIDELLKIKNQTEQNIEKQQEYNQAAEQAKNCITISQQSLAGIKAKTEDNIMEQQNFNNVVEQATSSVTVVQSSLSGVKVQTEENIRKQNNFNNSIRQGGNNADNLFRKIKAAVGAYAGIQGIKQIVGLSDTMVQTTARLNMLTESPEETEALKQSIYASAQRSRGDYMGTADSVSKLGMLAGNAFSDTDEIIRFTETFQKMAAVSGSSSSEASNAMYQLNQAMASGRLQGDEYRSIIENAPMMAQAIAEYMGKSQAELKELSSQGLITAEVIKGAMLNVSGEIDQKFAEMPMTWSQVWTQAMNSLLMMSQPALDMISWMAQNWDTLSPIVMGTAAAVGFFALALGIQAAATWIADAAAKGFFTTLLTNPLIWIALTIGVVIAAIYKWVQSVGGIKIAWLIVVDKVLSGWDYLKIGFYSGVNYIQNACIKMNIAYQDLRTNIVNTIGDMKVKVLLTLEDMVNGTIDRINGLINTANKIPGINIGIIDDVNFGTQAQLINEVERNARNNELAKFKAEAEASMKQNDIMLEGMRKQAQYESYLRRQEINSEQAKKAAEGSKDGINPEEFANAAAAQEYTANIKDDVNLSDESLKYLLEGVTMKYINNVNLTSPAPVMNVTINSGSNGISEGEIEEKIFGKFGVMLAEKRESSTTIAH